MALFDVAYNWMMDNEDSARHYAEVPDVGGNAISGINSRSFPTQFAAIATLPQSERWATVRTFYLENFWNHRYDQLASDEVAKRVFDAAVNMGETTAVRLLQRAINTLLAPTLIATDGTWGPATLAGANTPHPDHLVVAFIQQRKRHYQAIVAMNPENSKYLNAWLTRAGK